MISNQESDVLNIFWKKKKAKRTQDHETHLMASDQHYTLYSFEKFAITQWCKNLSYYHDGTGVVHWW